MKRHITRAILSCAALLLLTSTTSVLDLSATQVAEFPPHPSRSLDRLRDDLDPPVGRVRIPFSSRAELSDLARRIDIWEVQSEEGYVIAWLDVSDAEWLKAEGQSFQTLSSRALYPMTIPDYPCYRTMDELYAQLARWAQHYPALTELRTIGTSYEGRPIQAIRLTNQDMNRDKPLFVLMANIHGRELITNEVAMVFISRLLEGYGLDADITWLLDHHQIEVIVSANPDGHVKNEPGQPWSFWRKNTNPSYGCLSGQYGVDLNRNSSFLWDGSLDDPCLLVYPGPSPASESETQAVQAFLGDLFPDQRPDDLTSPAVEDAGGVFITLHSYGDLVLWPWGHTSTPAPNGVQLAALGRRMAIFNGYTAQQASELYPTTGTTDDWTYGELGVASYTFEIGQSFYPSCALYDSLIEPNIGALLYAAKVARTPYLTPFGPDVTDLVTGLYVEGATVGTTVTATVDSGWTGGQTVVAAEAYVDVPPWAGGRPQPLIPADGAFDEDREVVRTNWPELLPQHSLVLVRGMDADGVWGPFSAVFTDGDVGWDRPRSRTTGLPSRRISTTLRVVNTTPVSQTLSISGEGGVWPVTIVPTRTTVAAADSRPVTVTIAIPPRDDLAVYNDVLTLTLQSEVALGLVRRTTVEIGALWARSLLPIAVRDFGP